MVATRKNDKRQRLVAAADSLIYENGFNTTTLADIAKLAEVPLGNVYYYFKTKDTILDAVIQRRAAQFKELTLVWDQLDTPSDRIQAFIDSQIQMADGIAKYGCPMGSLCQELGKKGGAISNSAAKLMSEIVKWIEKQFKDMGNEAQAPLMAEHLIAGLHGLALLTLTFKDPSYLTKESNRLLSRVLSDIGASEVATA